jgi:hypothetical protein
MDQMIFVTEMRCVFNAVETGFFYLFLDDFVAASI